jgi:peptidoglycan/LPS O-acetylase OafA/YrhL
MKSSGTNAAAELAISYAPPRIRKSVEALNTIPSLDGIRAISVVIVFLSHAGLGKSIPGGFGVTVFFFLSGYLITTLLRMEHIKRGRLDLKAFYLRRALRILPPFYLVLTAGIVLRLTGRLGGELHVGSILSQTFVLGNYYLDYAYNRRAGHWPLLNDATRV